VIVQFKWKGRVKNRRFGPISRFISETIQDGQLSLQRETSGNSYAIYRMAPFSMTLNNTNPHFKVTPIFDAEYVSNGTIKMDTLFRPTIVRPRL